VLLLNYIGKKICVISCFMLLLEKKRIKKITLEVIEDENLQYGLSVLLFIEVSLCDMQLHYQKQRRRGGSIKSL